MQSLPEFRFSCRSPGGAIIGHILIVPEEDSEKPELAPLVQVDEAIAREHGETPVQLRELGRYEYEVQPLGARRDLRLRCRLIAWRRKRSVGHLNDTGRIETRNFCGTLLLELVEGEVNDDKPLAASAL